MRLLLPTHAVRPSPAAGRPQGRILIPNHEELLGLNQLPDSVFTDRFVNHMALCGYAYDKHEGRPKPYWTELATRFVYYCCSQVRDVPRRHALTLHARCCEAAEPSLGWLGSMEFVTRALCW